MRFFRLKSGFTLVELLVVIAIIGLLTSIAVVSLGGARQKARDLKRVTSIRQIQGALELYANEADGYPAAAQAIVLGTGSQQALCAGGWKIACGQGETVFMEPVPAAPAPDDGNCQDDENDFRYTAAPGENYVLTFCLGSQTGYLPAGVRTADPNAIR